MRSLLSRFVFAFLLCVGTLGGASCRLTALSAQPEAWNVMSLNIRYGTAKDGLNSWSLRKELLLGLLEGCSPQILGVQEALGFQLDQIEGRLSQYKRVGVGRDDGKQAGEYSAILYDSNRLQVLQHGTFWLSDNPEAVASTTWGNHIPRICTWAEFTSLESGNRFHVFNTHFDHESQESRERSARLILERIALQAQAGPVILMGDFNAGESNPAFIRLVTDASTSLRDSFRVLHPAQAGVGTFNGFKGRNDGVKIDGVLVSPHWSVSSAKINRTSEGQRWPSDHFPVEAELTL